MTNKPFIKLFHTPNSGYFYDVGKNEIVRVNEKLFTYLKGIMDGTETVTDSDTVEMFETLREAGYLSYNRPGHIKHAYTELLPLFLERKIERVTLQLTQECNFRCKYCLYSEEANQMQRTHSQKSMSWETAKKAIDFLRDHSVDSLRVNIGLYGGEPLLRVDLLKRVIEYAEEQFKGKPLTFGMTTNGSLLTDEIVAYLAEHEVDTLISLDGPKEIQDKNRVFRNGEGTYDTVIRNLHRIQEKFPEYMKKVRVNMVIDPSNNFDFINKINAEWKDLNMETPLTNMVDNTDAPVFIPEDFYIKSAYQQFLSYISYIGHYPQEGLSPWGENNIRDAQNTLNQFNPAYGISQVAAPGGPCVPGRTRLLVNVDEKFYPCERVNESELMCIGSLETGFDIEKAKKLLNVGAVTEEKCKNCWAIRMCTMCAKQADAGTELSAETKLKHCASVKGGAKNKLRAIILLKEIATYYKDIIKK